MIGLNIGGGKNHPRIKNWVIVDLNGKFDIHCDITKQPIPYKNNCIDFVFSSHTLEHIIPQKVDFVLSEFYRVLKPGGAARIIVPDLRAAIKAYIKKDVDFFKQLDCLLREPPPAPIGAQFVSWMYSSKPGDNHNGHCMAYDSDYLFFLLNRAGFKNIYKTKFKKSKFPEMQIDGLDRYPHGSLFIEAVK